MFIDECRISIKAGNGGNGCHSFVRTRKSAFKGPDGGNGGKGGDIIFLVDPKINSLLAFRYERHHKAEGGVQGGKRLDGKNGQDLVLKVPKGTCIFADETNELLADLNIPGQRFIAAKGGLGGRGNRNLITAANKFPKFAEKGEPGEELWLRLELKLSADIGIVGFPNVGKSTLISKMSNAKPKIADYPFTTLEPNLGVVYLDDGSSFLMADIPGIIEGAHEGQGLGDRFLRHIERTGFLLHMIDMFPYDQKDAWDSYVSVNNELKAYSEKLSQKPQFVVLNKMDMPDAEERRDKFIEQLKESGDNTGVLSISALTGEGVDALKWKLGALVKEHPAQVEVAEQLLEKVREKRPLLVEKLDEGEFRISGTDIERICSMTQMDNEYALQRLQRIFQQMGIVDQLRELGAIDGDMIYIGEKTSLEYVEDWVENPVEYNPINPGSGS